MAYIQPLSPAYFSKNAIPIEIIGAIPVQTSGVKAVSMLVFKDYFVPPGQAVRLVWSGVDIWIEAGVDDASGYRFPSSYTIDDAYLDSVIEYLQTGYFIDRDFDLERTTYEGYPAISFTAKQAGLKYSIAPHVDSILPLETDVEGVDEVLQPNFAKLLQVWLELDDAFKKIYENNLPLDYPVTGTTTKDIAEILHPYLTRAYKGLSDRPDLVTTTWVNCENTYKRFFLKYSEFYGEPPVVHKLGVTNISCINIGGLDIQSAPNETLPHYLRPTGYDSDIRCLRQGSKVISIQPEQPEYLYWINLTAAITSIQLLVTILYTDGTTDSYTTAAGTVSLLKKYAIAVGFVALDVNSRLDVGKICMGYTVRITDDAGNPVSSEYKYYFDSYRRWPRYFIYRNSLGGYQTLYTWGKGQKETTKTKEDVKKQVTESEAAVNGRTIEINQRLQHQYTVNTGYRSAREIALLDDFFISDERYLVNNGKLIPVGISTDKLTEPMDGDNLNAAPFTFYPLYDEVVFTDDATQPDDDSIQFGGGVFTPPVARAFKIYDSTAELNNTPGAVKYTNLARLAGLTDYPVLATQLGESLGQPLRTGIEITYNPTEGSFTIIIPGFYLLPGEELDVFASN